MKNRTLRFFLRTGAVQILCAQLFLIVQRMQLIIVHQWQDPAVLKLEAAVFGVQPTVWLQQFVTPPLTEWMMFSYVIYLVIYPGLGALIYFRRGERPLEDYLFTLAVTNVVCFLGFLAFPIAGPLYYMREAYTVPLKGGFFTGCGESIRANLTSRGQPAQSPLRDRDGDVDDGPPLCPAGILFPGPGYPLALYLHVFPPLPLCHGQRRWRYDRGCGYTGFAGARRSLDRRSGARGLRREDFHHRGERLHRLVPLPPFPGPRLGRPWLGAEIIRSPLPDGVDIALAFGDLTDPDSFAIPEGTDYVVHAASITSDLADEETCRKNILLLAVNLVGKVQALARPPKRLVFISTALTLGFGASEISETRPGMSAEFLPYTRNKIETEKFFHSHGAGTACRSSFSVRETSSGPMTGPRAPGCSGSASAACP